jgi:signal transduction histidine kinase
LSQRAVAEELEYSVVTLPPTLRHRRRAFVVVLVTLAAFGAVIPFANTPMSRIDSFVPTILAITFVTDLVTAVLLFSHFSATGSRAILVLASGYLFSSLIVIPHALTFPGAFAPTGLLGAGSQSAAWLSVSWRFGLAVASVGYALVARHRNANDQVDPLRRSWVYWSVAAVAILVCTLTLIVTAGDRFTPRLIVDGTVTPLGHYMNGTSALTNLLALLLLWTRRRSVLDLWLMVSICAPLCETAMVALFVTSRFSVGFYGVRILSLLVSKVVLIMLLSETMRLYARLSVANRNLERERANRLTNAEAVVAAIAHEIRQPLSSICNTAGSGKLLLARSPLNIADLKMALVRIEDDSFRVNDVVRNFRDLFRENEGEYELVDINSLTREAIQLLHKELDDHGITTVMNLEPELPIVPGHVGQLREVILNVVQNSIDAMATTKNAARVVSLKTQRRGSSIAISFQDTGPGIAPQTLESVFEPFISTKAKGTGLGLAICKMIVEQHGGKISATSELAGGARFEITLPTGMASRSVPASGE